MAFHWIRRMMQPAPHRKRLTPELIDSTYRRLRWQVFVGIFIGYAGYYLVRKNFTLAMPYLEKMGYSKAQLGFALSGVSVAYGLSKFAMGTVSDRSNPRVFMVCGLVVSALLMLVMGLMPWATSSVAIMFILLLLNGWVQGMGWPPSGRTMVHWFSTRERGVKMSIWNIAHNVGGGLIGPLAAWGLAMTQDWRSAFYVPAVLALGVAVFAWLTVRDTPQSEGLPSIEEYKHDGLTAYRPEFEREMTTREILMQHVLNNRNLWYIAVANIFVYMVRYGVIDWAPSYLSQAKGFNVKEVGWAYFAYEYAAIPGTLLCGYVSDKWFGGRRAPAGILFMVAVTIAVLVYWLNPPGHVMIDIIALISIGFLVYGPVMLIGLHALDLVPKKAAGTAAGLTGLFGYVGGAVSANVLIGWIVDRTGWRGGFITLVAACVLSIVCLAFTWNQGKREETA